MIDDETDESTSGSYDPSAPTPPLREPPLRSTAPQSEYTAGQVVFGQVVALVGFAIVFGLPLVLG